MKRALIVIIAAVLSLAAPLQMSAQKEKKTETVVFQTNLHCDKCKQTIEDSLPFEKGVKDVIITVGDKSVKVVFDPSKTDVMRIRRAIEKLGYTAELKDAAKE